MASRPVELQHQPLSERCGNLSIHTAPIRHTYQRTVCLPYASSSSCFQLFRSYGRLTRSLCSSPITGPSSLLRTGPPRRSASVLSPRGFRRLCFSLAIRALVPAVPRKSLHPVHAPYTPAAVCPVIRHLTDLSQRNLAPLVLTALRFFTARHRWVCLRSSPGHTPSRGHAPDFCSNAHDHGFRPQPLGVVWNQLLKAGPEGPTLIFYVAVRHVFLSAASFLCVSAAHQVY